MSRRAGQPLLFVKNPPKAAFGFLSPAGAGQSPKSMSFNAFLIYQPKAILSIRNLYVRMTKVN
jgi:hypothetical protein